MTKDALMSRANSLKKAVRQLVEYTEQAVDQQNSQGLPVLSNNEPLYKSQTSGKNYLGVPGYSRCMDTLKVGLFGVLPFLIRCLTFTNLLYSQVMPPIESGSSSEVSPCPSPRMFLSPSETRCPPLDKMFLLPSPLPSCQSSRSPSAADIRVSAISPLPDVRRESACDDMIALPAPDQFADRLAHRKSFPSEADPSWYVSDNDVIFCIKIRQIQNSFLFNHRLG